MPLKHSVYFHGDVDTCVSHVARGNQCITLSVGQKIDGL